jgi:hypothetical protein
LKDKDLSYFYFLFRTGKQMIGSDFYFRAEQKMLAHSIYISRMCHLDQENSFRRKVIVQFPIHWFLSIYVGRAWVGGASALTSFIFLGHGSGRSQLNSGGVWRKIYRRHDLPHGMGARGWN